MELLKDINSYFIPKWEALLDVETWIMAMGQAFFSLYFYLPNADGNFRCCVCHWIFPGDQHADYAATLAEKEEQLPFCKDRDSMEKCIKDYLPWFSFFA